MLIDGEFDFKVCAHKRKNTSYSYCGASSFEHLQGPRNFLKNLCIFSKILFFFRRVYSAPSCSEFIRRKPSPFGKIRVYSAVKRVYSARTESIRSLNKFWNSKIYSLNKTEFIRQPSLFGQFPSLFGESAGLLHIISSLFGEF